MTVLLPRPTLLRLVEKILFFTKSSKSTTDNSIVCQRLEFVLNEYGNSILRVAYSYLHNMSDAEDILQDTVMQYIKKCPDFENNSKEKSWLIKVAVNLSKNKIKYYKIRNCAPLEDNIASPKEKDLAFVWEAVKALPQKYSEVIHLYYHEGYSSNEIAEILLRKESTIRSQLKRGRDLLKSKLKEAYDFEI